MDLAYSDVKDGAYVVGSPCHQQKQGAVAVWVVTDMHGNILLNNQADSTEGPRWVVAKGRITITRFWSASTAMIVCNVEGLAREGEDTYPIFPDLPRGVIRNLQGNRYGTTAYPLDKNDEICVWCGYIDHPRPVTQDDLRNGLLLRTFVGVIDTIVGSGSANQGTTIIIQCRDRMKYLMDSLSTYNSTDFAPIGLAKEKPEEKKDDQTGLDTTKRGNDISRTEVILELARRSVGHLENAYSIEKSDKGIGTPCGSVCGLKISQGYTKDFLIDQGTPDQIFEVYEGLSFDRNYFGLPMTDSSAPPPNTKYDYSTTASTSVGAETLRLTEITKQNNLDIAKYDRQAAENINSKITTPDEIEPQWAEAYKTAFLKAYKDKFNQDYVEPTQPTSEASGGGGGVPFIGGTTRTPKGLSDIDIAIRARHPAMNIITGRKAFDVAADGRNFAGMSAQVTDRVPVEYIKFLAMQEPWPTEFFCDHRSGEFWYAPRGLDITGLQDPARLYRTYFYRHAGSDILQVLGQSYAHPAQALLLLREESSIINWRSNIIVTNSPSNNTSNTKAIHLRIVPPFLEGRAFPCTYYTVVDETIADNVTELVATAMAFARLYGKELKAASMHVIGDPSLCPGEAVQVLGSPLYGGGYRQATQDSEQKQWAWDRNAVSDYYGDYKAIHQELLDELKSSAASPDGKTQEQLDEELVNEAFGDVEKEAPKTPAVAPPFSLDDKDLSPEQVKQKYIDLAKQYELPQIDGWFVSNHKERFLQEYQKKYGKIDAAAATSGNLSGNTSLYDLNLERKRLNPVDVTSLTQAEMMCPAVFSGGGETNQDNPVTFREDPRTIWRVEAVIHKFNDSPGDGYKTEVALLSPW